MALDRDGAAVYPDDVIWVPMVVVAVGEDGQLSVQGYFPNDPSHVGGHVNSEKVRKNTTEETGVCSGPT